MSAKQMTPYERLLKKGRDWAFAVRFPKRKTMWVYPAEKLSANYRLDGLCERVIAADQLGYDVRLHKTDAGLEVQYVQRAIEPPPEFCW